MSKGCDPLGSMQHKEKVALEITVFFEISLIDGCFCFLICTGIKMSINMWHGIRSYFIGQDCRPKKNPKKCNIMGAGNTKSVM